MTHLCSPIIRKIAYFGAVFLWVLACAGLVMAQDIRLLEEQYRRQLEQYRAQQEAFLISLQQYTTLKTLASQEEAVRSFRNLQFTRIDLVTNYLQRLEQNLEQRGLLDPLAKSSVSGMLSADLRALGEHRSRVDVAIDRIKIDQEAVWFASQEPTLLSHTDRALSLIAIGRMQEGIAALGRAKNAVDQWIESEAMSETERVERRRGSDELGRSILAVQTQVAAALVVYNRAASSESSVQVYPEIRSILSQGYIALAQGIAFATELTQ